MDTRCEIDLNSISSAWEISVWQAGGVGGLDWATQGGYPDSFPVKASSTRMVGSGSGMLRGAVDTGVRDAVEGEAAPQCSPGCSLRRGGDDVRCET